MTRVCSSNRPSQRAAPLLNVFRAAPRKGMRMHDNANQDKPTLAVYEGGPLEDADAATLCGIVNHAFFECSPFYRVQLAKAAQRLLAISKRNEERLR